MSNALFYNEKRGVSMQEIKLRTYQIEAVEAIKKALKRHQKHIVVEMATGSGKGIVLAKTLEYLNCTSQKNILVVTDRMTLKDYIEQEFINKTFKEFDKNSILVTTEQRVLRNSNESFNEYQVVIFYDTNVSEKVYEILACKEKMVIVFRKDYRERIHRLFTPEEVVFSYSYKDAVEDGVLTPAMDTRVFGIAAEVFTKQLLEQFGYVQAELHLDNQNNIWDLVVCKSTQRIWVECKTYKSQVVSPSAANSLLNEIVMRKMKQNIPQQDIVLLVVLSKIPTFQKDEIYRRYRIIVWDIENLVFYSKNNQTLLKQLAQITYFPIDYIEGQPSLEADAAQLLVVPKEDKHIQEAEKEADETSELIQKLIDCKPGKKHASEYEKICEQILRTLFEANYFNKLRNQYKTKDEHFRMDLIGALKINQDNEKSMHPLWQMLVEHYNSHFVVFEFKNYSKEIDQNLIYITEKYLFDAALRNVAIIISRKGFSKTAKFASEGCLKEHGKLIFNITDNDLIEMLKLKSDRAADYLLDKLEEFLMGISK